MPTAAQSDRVGLAYVEESSFGVFPSGPPTLKDLRITGETLGQDTQTTESQEIRPDRMTVETARTNISAAGDINFELSYGSFDDLLEGALCNSWATNVLTQGTEIHSYSFERSYEDLSNEFVKLVGMMVETFNLAVSAENLVTGSFGFMGKSEASATATGGDGSNTAVGTNPIMNAVDHVSQIQEGGSGATVLAWSMSLKNNLRSRLKIGALGPFELGLGNISLTGTMQAYFESKTLFDKYLNYMESSQNITLDDGTNSYAIVIPALKYTAGRRVAGGQNQDIIADLQWTAERDTSTGNMIQITRA